MQTAYGQQFAAASPVLILLGVGALFAAAAGQVNQLMLLCDLEHLAFTMNGVLLTAWVTAGWYLATNYGLLGVAALGVSTSVSYNLAATIQLYRRKAIRSFAWRDRSSAHHGSAFAG